MSAINIVFDVSEPSHPVFVEVENDSGASVKVGEWIARPDGLHQLRITAEDLG